MYDLTSTSNPDRTRKITVGQVKDNISSTIVLDGYATTADLQSCATTEDLQNYATTA